MCASGTGYGPPPPTDLPGTAERPSIPSDSAGDHEIKPLPPNEPQANMLADLNRVNLSASQKKEGRGWYAVFSPEVQRVLDVELVHHLAHDSVACSVSFSPDGKYLATGCNRLSRIWDVTTGENIITLRDDSLTKKDDVYIRSVCFSPDGKYLATGSEERNVKVGAKRICPIIAAIVPSSATYYVWLRQALLACYKTIEADLGCVDLGH